MTRSKFRWTGRSSVAVVAIAGVIAASLAACSGSSGKPKPTPTTSSNQSAPSTPNTNSNDNPVAAPGGGVRNVTFYYAGSTPLKPGKDLTKLGSPSIVVTTPKPNDANSIAAIHSIGAKAYRYVQFYWAPDNAAFEGINLAKHPDWAFCRNGNTPLVGRITKPKGKSTPWYFIDANETAVRAALRAILEHFKKLGWDGVMFDRGGAATQSATDASGKPVWDATSSCTGQPYKRGATFADAYVNMLGLAHQVGLKVLLNGGASPFDPIVPLRPDPSNPACQAKHWSDCKFLSDVWNNVDLVLNESISFPKDQNWQREFVANERSEQDPEHGKRVVGLITTYTLGGPSHQTRAEVYYEWSRVKLFDLAMAVNTGDGGCNNPTSGVCNRYGAYPELTDIRFGAPTTKAPSSSACIGGSSIHCVWTRAYADGINVLNASAQARTGVQVPVGGSKCRYVYDSYAKAPLANNSCVTKVTVDLPAWSGRPLVYSDKPWPSH